MLSSLTRSALILLQSRKIPGVIRQFARPPLRRALFGDGISVTDYGITLTCHLDNGIEYHFALGIHMGALKYCLALLESGSVFVDVGANCGLFSVAAAKIVGPDGRVLAIEPNPEMVTRLRTNIAENSASVVIAPEAVGETDGEAVLNIDGSDYGCSNVLETQPSARQIRVPMTTLAAIVERAHFDRVDVLKIDVEGYEDRVLLPFFSMADPTLWPRHIFMETRHSQNWQRDLMGELARIGYRVHWQDDDDAHLVLSGGTA